MRKSKVRFIIALLIPLMIGVMSALLTRNNMALYQNIEKPPLSPPSIVFPIAWTILYLMMGAASYLATTAEGKAYAIFVADIWYIMQLFLNFGWSIIFFKMSAYLFAFIWLIVMHMTVIVCTVLYYRIDKRAGWLMIPYNIWMAFAAYLNLAIVIMN